METAEQPGAPDNVRVLPSHGATEPRGLVGVPRSALYEGRFGRMFRRLPPFEPDDDLLGQLAESMTDEGLFEGDSSIAAGYTYLGQFIDHDITLDTTSRLQRVNDPNALRNFRTPRFDLDSIYGGGPLLAPFLYQDDGRRLRIGRNADGEDLPRTSRGDGGRRRALLGDPRNDENVILSQLHLAFLRYHNRVVEELAGDAKPRGESLFEEATRIVRWHYQWLVIHDFVRRIVGPEVLNDILRYENYAVAPTHGGEDKRDLPRLPKIQRRFFTWRNQPFIPVEFAAAAYRFGHSMVRDTYTLNPAAVLIPFFSVDPKGPLFDLRGFDERPRGFQIEWSRFFSFGHLGFTPPQRARRIDTQIISGLQKMPTSILLNPRSAIRPNTRYESLAERDLLRGKALGLPTGQAVAKTMGLPAKLTVPAGAFELPDELRMFGEHTPLWYYVLKEAEYFHKGDQLGPVGGRIVAEVLIGLLEGDPTSYLRVEPNWTPTVGKFGVRAGQDEKGAPTVVFEMPELLRFAGAPL
jgi:hypothetical protein